jgi:2-oxoglutarate dehydrogenase E2 component (dihydrolipoamide succinyltransferase)
MALLIDVTMPQLGESVTEGTITKWHVREGDTVDKDQTLLEIATDKADSELPAPVSGRVATVLVREGEVAQVHAVLCQLEEGAGAQRVADRPAPEPDARVAPASAPPQRSATGSTLATPTARKAALENDVNLSAVRGSGDRGRITRDDVLRASAAAVAPPHTEPQIPHSPATPLPLPPRQPRPPPAAPSRVAQLTQMIDQGGGFVPPIPGVGYGAFKVPAYRKSDGDQLVPFTRRRRITADHMTYSKFTSPHVVTVAEVDLHRASRLREAHKDRYKKEGHALTILAFVVVAAAKALREHLDLNARVLDDSFVILQDINLGVAVDSPSGLVVPVVRRADELGVRGIVRTVDELAKRARSGKIAADDLSGSTFSVTNPGIKGNLFGGAIINQPNVGILRMGEIQKRVVVVEGEDGEDQIAIHPVMFMALSYDHRVVDGVSANSFLWRVTELLEKADFEV